MLTRARFTIDNNDGEPIVRVGYHDNTRRWNGWACPAFDYATMEGLIAMLGADVDGARIVSEANEITDRYILIDDNNNPGDPAYIPGFDAETEDGVKHLYSFDGIGWTWTIDTAAWTWGQESFDAGASKATVEESMAEFLDADQEQHDADTVEGPDGTEYKVRIVVTLEPDVADDAPATMTRTQIKAADGSTLTVTTEVKDGELHTFLYRGTEPLDVMRLCGYVGTARSALPDHWEG